MEKYKQEPSKSFPGKFKVTCDSSDFVKYFNKEENAQSFVDTMNGVQSEKKKIYKPKKK